MIGWIVAGCTVASTRNTTCPPRSIRPRTGVCPSPACRGLALPPACGGVQAAPLGHRRGLALVAGHDIDLVDLDLAFQPHGWSLGDQAAAQLLRHGLHI